MGVEGSGRGPRTQKGLPWIQDMQRPLVKKREREVISLTHGPTKLWKPLEALQSPRNQWPFQAESLYSTSPSFLKSGLKHFNPRGYIFLFPPRSRSQASPHPCLWPSKLLPRYFMSPSPSHHPIPLPPTTHWPHHPGHSPGA